jgi:hypothetical protein
METSEIVALSEAIAARAKMADLPLGTTITERRSYEVSVAPADVRHAGVVVEIDPKDASGERVKGVRVRLAQPEAARWDELEARFGPFRDVAELMDAPEVPPTRVGAALPDGLLPQTIRIMVDKKGNVTSFTVREHYD